MFFLLGQCLGPVFVRPQLYETQRQYAPRTVPVSSVTCGVSVSVEYLAGSIVPVVSRLWSFVLFHIKLYFLYKFVY